MKDQRWLAGLTLTVSLAVVSTDAIAQTVSAAPETGPVLPVSLVPTTDLKEAVQSALNTHPAVRISSAEIEQRLAEERIVKSEGRPVIEYSLQPGYNPQSDRDAILQLNISARVPVYDFGRLRARRNAAASRTVQYRQLFANREELVALDVVNAYLQFALWRDALVEADRHLEQLAQIRRRIDMRVAAGLADLSDLRRTDVSISRARLQRNQVESEMAQAVSRIHMISSTSGEPEITFDEAAAMLRANNVEPIATAEGSPTVAAARADWDARREEVAAARASRYPSISVGVTNSSYLMDERGDARGGSSFDNRTQFGVFLTGRVQLGGGARYQVEAAEAASAAAQSGYHAEVLKLDMAIVNLNLQRSEAATRLEGAGQVTGVLEEARDLYWQEYILSKRRLTEVFDIEREIYQSRVDQLQARADLLGAVAETLGVQGQLVETLEIPSRAGLGR